MVMADNNIIDETKEPMDTDSNSEELEEFDEEDDEEDEDFISLNLQLDELQSALDILENKTDAIHAKLVELLQTNRETRQQFQETLDNENKLGPQV